VKSDNQYTRDYQRAARLLASKLGADWQTLPREQVEEYMRKLEIAGQMCLTKGERRQQIKDSDAEI
jgi:hypothetical protein